MFDHKTLMLIHLTLNTKKVLVYVEIIHYKKGSIVLKA